MLLVSMELLSFLNETKTFFLGTVENGKPKLRPFGAVAEFEGKMYFVTSNTKNVYKQIAANPNVCVCACNADRKWIRIEGTAKFDTRTAAKQKMIDDNPVLLQHKRYTSAHDPAMEVFFLENLKTEIY